MSDLAAQANEPGVLLERNMVSFGACSADDVVNDFAAIVREQPNRAALMHNGATVSYRELAERIRRQALHLRVFGFGVAAPSPLIGTMVSHAPSVVEQLFGILQAGAAFCPIDSGLPVARQQQLAEVMGLDRVFSSGNESLVGDEFAGDVQAALPRWRPDDPAYVLCTSGSTGRPKPVVVSRNALAVTVRALRDLFALTPHDRVLQFASLGWDTCLEEILPALTAGATVVFDDAAHSHSFPRFVRMLADREVTVLDLPTAFWHELVLFLHEEHVALPDSVRLVVIGGERIDRTRFAQWRDRGTGNIRLLNTYGCTETTMITHAVQLSGPGTESAVSEVESELPLGRALPHVRDHVTDEGELLVSGPALADGYLGLLERTAAEFPVIDHGDGPARWFRTGDLVTRGEGGLLYPCGRADEQVKVLGVRVHPAEVETHLSAHPAVRGAVVIGERSLGRTTLAAYVVPIGAVTPGELKRHLRSLLPSQFVPSKLIFVRELSYTSSGKIDRTATQRAAADYDSRGAGR